MIKCNKDKEEGLFIECLLALWGIYQFAGAEHINYASVRFPGIITLYRADLNLFRTARSGTIYTGLLIHSPRFVRFLKI